jgi:hypothetical protein
MMDNLLRLYRYLSTCYHVDQESAYGDTYRALEQVLDLLGELDWWGRCLIEHGGMDWEQAEALTERIIEMHKTALCDHAGQSSLEAILDFAQTHIPLEMSRKELIKRLQAPTGVPGEEGTTE